MRRRMFALNLALALILGLALNSTALAASELIEAESVSRSGGREYTTGEAGLYTFYITAASCYSLSVYHTETNEPARAICSAEDQVLLSWRSNVYYLPANTTVTVSASTKDDWWSLDVGDVGMVPIQEGETVTLQHRDVSSQQADWQALIFTPQATGWYEVSSPNGRYWHYTRCGITEDGEPVPDAGYDVYYLHRGQTYALLMTAVAGVQLTVNRTEGPELSDQLVGGGDTAATVKWTYDSSTETVTVDAVPEGHRVMVLEYDEQGRFIGAQVLMSDRITATVARDTDRLKFIWLDEDLTPQCEPQDI